MDTKNTKPWYRENIFGLPVYLLGTIILAFAVTYALNTSVNVEAFQKVKNQIPEFRSECLNNNRLPEEFYLIKNNEGKVVDTAFVSYDGKRINDLANQR
ncbi:hypothetical protein J4399_05150 [Candidatus Woesearchaeota archaeon]|nr:hypothetical protein [Candidatus Woesearchaeota archaeon]HIJ01094.1 hypothetical protein [Candidatus Woesearchaeota archaeon]